MEKLSVSPSFKRRIREGVIRDYWKGGHQNPPFSFNVAPTILQVQVDLGVEDY